MTPSLTCFELSLFDTGATLAAAILAQLSPEAQGDSPLMQVKMPMQIRPGESDPPLAAPLLKRSSKRPRETSLAARTAAGRE